LSRDDDAGHYPDLGYVDAEGGRHAIEVELHSKSNYRLRAILRAYQRASTYGTIESVTYVWTRLPSFEPSTAAPSASRSPASDTASLDKAIATVRDLNAHRRSDADR
jgi:hypothetical protein